jgi:hypothetical protein
MNKLFWFLCVLALLSSCTEDTRINEVGGVIYSDCNGTPLAYAEIALRSNISTGFSDREIIGAATSDRNGSFKFTYEVGEDATGNADLILITTNGFVDLLNSLDVDMDHNFSLYYPNQSAIEIKLSGTKQFGVTDTLFYGSNATSDESFVVNPMAGIVGSINAVIPNQYNGTESVTFYYGVGTIELKRSKEALSISDSSYNHIGLNLLGCSQNESVDLVIN